MNKQQLAAKIWESANQMRSKIEANKYKDYILGFILSRSHRSRVVTPNPKNLPSVATRDHSSTLMRCKGLRGANDNMEVQNGILEGKNTVSIDRNGRENEARN